MSYPNRLQMQEFDMNHAYWGPSFSNGYVRQLLDERQEELSLRVVQLSCTKMKK